MTEEYTITSFCCKYSILTNNLSLLLLLSFMLVPSLNYLKTSKVVKYTSEYI